MDTYPVVVANEAETDRLEREGLVPPEVIAERREQEARMRQSLDLGNWDPRHSMLGKR